MALKTEEIVYKYLKYKENIESFSSLSIKAYYTDLNQALLSKQKFVENYDELWSLVRLQLNQWGSLSLASRNRKIATLKSFFSWLFEQELTDKNYSHQLVCPKIPKKIPHFLSLDEVLAVLKHVNNNSQKTDKSLQQKTLFLLLYGAGLRISEACNLKWKDINFKVGTLLITGKGNKQRLSALPQFCISHLENEFNANKNNHHEYVFGVKALSPRAGYQLIRSLGAEVGLMNPLHPHALRHSYATHLLADGVNLRILQKLLGHQSLQATEKYTHLSVDHLARLIDKTHPLAKLKISS